MNSFRIIVIIGIILILIAIGILIYYNQSYGAECLKNPIKYYETTQDTVCSCANLFGLKSG